jgi:hypothetical protein
MQAPNQDSYYHGGPDVGVSSDLGDLGDLGLQYVLYLAMIATGIIAL